MPGSRYNYKKEANWWEYRTELEKILIAATITAVIVVIALMIVVILLSKQDIRETSNVYIAEPIIYERKISQLEQIIDPSINPCDDFYKFACGNLLKKANGDENLGPFFVIQEKAKRQIEEMYNEPIRDKTDHKIVQVAKNLYKHCMNESAIERDGLKTIKNVLEKLGGWPVVKGSNWDESKFSWIRTEYILRDFGYFYSSFLTISVGIDPKNDQKFILQVALPEFDDFGVELFDKQRLMVDVALAFGADEGRALNEISEVLEFMLDIKREIFQRGNDEPPQRLTLSEIQKQYEFINWIEFINTIVGSRIRLSIHDHLLFPPIKTLRKWYDFIQHIPKRVQANYLIWKMLEKTIPNIPQLQKLKFEKENYETRSTYCIEQIRTKFTPSPIDIMYVRRHLPLTKREKIRKIINDMKLEFRSSLEDVHWMHNREKHNAIAKVSGLTEIIGAPDELFENEILDEMDFDLVNDPESSSYLALLASVERNRQSWLYNQMYSTKNEFELSQWKLQTASAIGDYCYEDNIIRLPATIFQDVIFDEGRPQYFNYGSMGTLMGHHFLYVLGESTSFFDQDGNIIESLPNLSTNSLFRKSDCLIQQMNNNTTKFMLDLILPQSLGLQLSYSAFRKNSKNDNAIEDNYRPEQLFWISAASYFCQPSNRNPEDEDLFSFLVSVPMLNNPNFGKDFVCPVGTKMNPKHKCDMFS